MSKNPWLVRMLLAFFMTVSSPLAVADATTTWDIEDKLSGIASYFSDDLQGQLTANGERYDKYDLTAAHVSLPFGTVLKVVNLDNNHSVYLRINSRTHPKNKRVLDVSKQAAKELGFLRAGLARVEITILQLGEA